jgi:isopentenyl-diphosphate delta-isomerase
MEYVILVDENDQQTGLMEKMEAHEKGLLHRAFSVFVFNDQNQLLIHQRAAEKYHSGGLWTNTCCSHPREQESITDAGQRRLQEEMGFTCAVEPVFSFIYKADLDGGMIEHEFDHVLIGRYNAAPNPNPEEVMDWRYVDLEEIVEDLSRHPEKYTAWFRIVFDKVKGHFLKEVRS